MGKNRTQRNPQRPSTRERLEEKRKARKEEQPNEDYGVLLRMRGYFDALVFAYLLAMFIRSYVFELFMIPTGSMTPTLIGDHAREVAFDDYDEDGIDDVIYTYRTRGGRVLPRLQIYLMNDDGTYRDQVFLDKVPPNKALELARTSPQQKDMILVNKFAYWFKEPERGDIAVFKVPHRPPRYPFDPDKPVYIKRVLGLPGEKLEILPAQIEKIGANDPQRISNKYGGTELHVRNQPIQIDGVPDNEGFEWVQNYAHVEYAQFPTLNVRKSDVINVDEDSIAMVGDNSASSSDSRYWGSVPLNNLRGKAVLRYWPAGSAGFLK